MRSIRIVTGGLACMSLLCAACWQYFSHTRLPASLDAVPPTPRLNHPQQYAGSQSCRECHPQQFELWANSGHALAERPLHIDRDKPAFTPKHSFQHGSQTSHARFRDGQCDIVTLGFHSNLQGLPRKVRPLPTIACRSDLPCSEPYRLRPAPYSQKTDARIAAYAQNQPSIRLI